VEPAARVRERERHGSQALGGRVDQDHGAFFPRLAGRLVARAAPQVDDLLAAVVGAAGAAQLAASEEVLDERIARRFETGLDAPLDARRAAMLQRTSAPSGRRLGASNRPRPGLRLQDMADLGREAVEVL